MKKFHIRKKLESIIKNHKRNSSTSENSIDKITLNNSKCTNDKLHI